MPAPRIVLMRGTSASPWELQAWERLHREGHAHVTVVLAPDNLYDIGDVDLPVKRVRTVSGLVPGAVPGAVLAKAVGQRHLGLAAALEGADIVHAAELGYWFTWQAARLKRRLGFKLAVTVWETLPFVDAYRTFRTRPYRREVLRSADLFLPATARAREALLLEGAPEERIRVSPPGVDVRRFAEAARAHGGKPILSAGRLVWEKGHQDVLRALAWLRRRGHYDARALILGRGPEEPRLRSTAEDLGVADRAELRGYLPWEEVPAVYAGASCLVLASLPTPFWEEQFGMVLVEAMAARLPVVASASGAIPEVVGGYAELFAPGDWLGLARALVDGPLAEGAQPPEPDPGRLERFSVEAAAERLRSAYAELLGS